MRKQLLRCVFPTCALLAAAALSPADGRAKGIAISGEVEYLDSEQDIESKLTGAKSDTGSSRFSQIYHIELDKQIFPYLDFRTGLQLERNKTKTTTDDLRIEFADRTRAHFFEVTLDNPAYRASLTYRDTEDRTDATNLPELTLLREEYSGFLHWRPDALPSADLSYRRTRTHDKPLTRETVLDFFNLNSKYSYENLALDYTYTRNDLDDRLEGFGQLQVLHEGGVDYTTRILGGRVLVTAGSQLTYRDSESDRGRVRLPTSPPQGAFYLLDDSTPGSNSLGEFTTVDLANPLTNLDIGPDGARNPVSFGVGFSSPTSIDTIHVLPLEDSSDPSLASPSEINAVADLFSWRVFSSDDQETWTELNVTRTTYEVFENRFEISFSSPTDVRFLKVATEPLSGGATRRILISQLQTFETPAGSKRTVQSFRQIHDLGLRYELSSSTSTFADVFYKVEDLDPSDGKKTWLTNSIGLRHEFGPRLVGTARYMRAVIGRPDEDDEVQTSYVASLRADYLATFYQTLTYSARYNRDEDGSTSTNSIWLRNNAELHPNWSASLDLGYLRDSRVDGRTTSGATLRLVSRLAPNRRMQFRLTQRSSWTKEEEGNRSQHKLDLQAFFVPTDTLSVVANISYNDDGLGDPKLSQDYSVSWAPFPDGDLDFSLAYRRFENRSGRRSDTLTPELRWRLRPGLLLVLSYSIGSEETETEQRDFNTFNAALQFSFR